MARLEDEVAKLMGILRGTHDLEGNPLPPPATRNPRDPEEVRALRKRLGMARAKAKWPVGEGRGRANSEQQRQAFIRAAVELEKELAELELQLEERKASGDSSRRPRKAPRKRAKKGRSRG